MEDIIYEFRNIVEESRTEDRQDYYIKLRNTLDLLEKLEEENKERKKHIHNLEIENGRLRIENKTLKETESVSIPISVIQNTLDELQIDRNAIKKEIEEAKKEKNKEYYADLLSHLRVNYGAIQVLKEILEKGNK